MAAPEADNRIERQSLSVREQSMMLQWNWMGFGALSTLVVYQQFRMYLARRVSTQREELFQIVTENAADMIALVDVKGRRLYNSPAYKRVLGYSATELSETSSFDQIHPDDRFKVLEAAARRAALELVESWNTASSTRTAPGGSWNRSRPQSATRTARSSSWSS
jgi:PAS domain S-box-containing protein